MKKKIQKPLTLNRETLTSLSYRDLREPVGMASQLNTCGCPVETQWTCGWVNTQCVGW